MYDFYSTYLYSKNSCHPMYWISTHQWLKNFRVDISIKIKHTHVIVLSFWTSVLLWVAQFWLDWFIVAWHLDNGREKYYWNYVVNVTFAGGPDSSNHDDHFNFHLLGHFLEISVYTWVKNRFKDFAWLSRPSYFTDKGKNSWFWFQFLNIWNGPK